MLDVVGRVLAHDVDDRRVRLLRVVQVGETVGEARAEVQQGRGGLPGHPVIAVGGACQHALEQAQHAAHARHLVEGGDEVHLRRARVGEANVDAARKQRADEAFGTVHLGGISHFG